MIPLRILLLPEYQSLPYPAKHVLTCMAGRFNGHNNGDLSFTREVAHEFGIKSQDTRTKALATLLESGFIVKTFQGGLKPLGPTRWALAWHKLDCRYGTRLDAKAAAPEDSAKHIYRTVARTSTGPQHGPVRTSDGTVPRSTVGASTGPPHGPPLESAQDPRATGSL